MCGRGFICRPPTVPSAPAPGRRTSSGPASSTWHASPAGLRFSAVELSSASERERDELCRLILIAYGEGDVLLPVDHVRHRQTSHLSRNAQLGDDRTGRLVIRAQDPASTPSLARKEQGLRHEERCAPVPRAFRAVWRHQRRRREHRPTPVLLCDLERLRFQLRREIDEIVLDKPLPVVGRRLGRMRLVAAGKPNAGSARSIMTSTT